MTNREASRRRLCLDCGVTEGASLWRTTKGENPGRLLRLCEPCRWAHEWDRFGLVEREPLVEEVPTEFVEGEWRFPEADGAVPSAVVTYATEPSPETGHVGWLWWALGRMGEAASYEDACRMAVETVQRVIDDRMAVL